MVISEAEEVTSLNHLNNSYTNLDYGVLRDFRFPLSGDYNSNSNYRSNCNDNLFQETKR